MRHTKGSRGLGSLLKSPYFLLGFGVVGIAALAEAALLARGRRG